MFVIGRQRGIAVDRVTGSFQGSLATEVIVA
jgi:hypothetical protein